MIDHDAQLKLQALLDGELPEREAAELKARLAGSPEAQQLLAELRNTRAALNGHEAEIKLPESREFFWSKIRREIQLEDAAAAPAPKDSWLVWWRRKLVPLGGVAVMALCLTLLLMNPGGSKTAQFGGETEVASDDMNVATYNDQQENATVVWHSDAGDDASSSETTQPVTP